jgi:peptidoglycan/LPS O-acetylase OafA/YrhL
MQPKETEWPVLGGARFILALVVAVAHLAFFAPAQWVYSARQLSGFAAVLGFLFISGFSIAASLERERHLFYYRRLLRLLPLYVPVVLGSALLPDLMTEAGRGAMEPTTYGQTVLSLCFMQCILTPFLETNPPLWTLSLEVAMYAAAPFLRSSRLVLVLAIGSAAIYATHWLTGLPGMQHTLFGLMIPFLGWAWLLGFWFRSHQASPHAIVLLLAVSGTVLLLNHRSMPPLAVLTVGATVLALGYGRNIGGQLPGWAKRGLNWAGDLSYPLYVAHWPAYLVLGLISDGLPAWVYLAAAIVAAALLHSVYDRPVKRLIDQTVGCWLAGRKFGTGAQIAPMVPKLPTVT